MSRTDRGSLPIALLVAIVAAGLVALLMPLAVTQIKSTTFDNSRTQEINAAQSGLSVGLGLVRAAASPAARPCSATPISGDAGTDDRPATYRVRIDYYLLDPTALTPAELADGSKATTCADKAAARWAVVTSTGDDDRAERTLRSIYAFPLGGTLYVWSTDLANLRCLDAGDRSSGAAVTARPCGDELPQQLWVYTGDRTVQLAGSPGGEHPTGLCLGDGFALAPCAPGDAKQTWNMDDAGRVHTAKSDAGLTSDTSCLTTSSSTLTTAACTAADAWVPGPLFAAGAASAALYRAGGGAPATAVQYLNEQTSRCLDFADGVPTVRLCKQGVAAGYQAFSNLAGAAGQLKNGSYCLKSEGTGAIATSPACASGTSQLWQLVPAGAGYQLKAQGGAGGCLAVVTSTADYFNRQYPRLRVMACSATDSLQIWAARPASGTGGASSGLSEISSHVTDAHLVATPGG